MPGDAGPGFIGGRGRRGGGGGVEIRRATRERRFRFFGEKWTIGWRGRR